MPTKSQIICLLYSIGCKNNILSLVDVTVLVNQKYFFGVIYKKKVVAHTHTPPIL